jgi:hypothetical protein
MSTLCLLGLLSGSLGTLAAAEDLRYNPFAGTPPKPPEQSSPATTNGAGGASGAAQANPLTLKAVIPLGNPPLANIDGKIIAVGEKFGSYTLVSVGEEGVTLQRGGRRMQLRFEYGKKKEAATTAPASPVNQQLSVPQQPAIQQGASS